jgi:hypothetical protein
MSVNDVMLIRIDQEAIKESSRSVNGLLIIYDYDEDSYLMSAHYFTYFHVICHIYLTPTHGHGIRLE